MSGEFEEAMKNYKCALKYASTERKREIEIKISNLCITNVFINYRFFLLY